MAGKLKMSDPKNPRQDKTAAITIDKITCHFQWRTKSRAIKLGSKIRPMDKILPRAW
jgi:hypothetical protein